MKGYIQRESDKALKDSGNSLGPNLTQEKLHQEVPQKPSRNSSGTSGVLVIQSSGSQLNGPENHLPVSLLHSRGVGIPLYILKVGCNEHRQFGTTAQKDYCSSLFQKR